MNIAVDKKVNSGTTNSNVDLGTPNIDHGTANADQVELFKDVWSYCQNDEYDKKAWDEWHKLTCVIYDAYGKLARGRKVLPDEYKLDITEFREHGVYKSNGALMLHAIPILKCFCDPAIRNMPRTINWVFSMVNSRARSASESCAEFLRTPLEFKDLRHHNHNFYVEGEGPFNPGEVMRTSMVRRISQRRYYGIGEVIVLKTRDSPWDDARCVTVVDYKENGTEDDDDINIILTNVLVVFMWKCNQRVDELVAGDIHEYYVVYRTDRRIGSLNDFHFTTEELDERKVQPYISTIPASSATQSKEEARELRHCLRGHKYYVGESLQREEERTQQVEDKENMEMERTQLVDGKETQQPPSPRKKRISFCNAGPKIAAWTHAKSLK
jgi:hypothetical protein